MFYFHDFAVIRTCKYPLSSNESPQTWRSQIKSRSVLLGNWFLVIYALMLVLPKPNNTTYASLRKAELQAARLTIKQTFLRRLWQAQLRAAGHHHCYWAVNHVCVFLYKSFSCSASFSKFLSCFSTFQTFLETELALTSSPCRRELKDPQKVF